MLPLIRSRSNRSFPALALALPAAAAVAWRLGARGERRRSAALHRTLVELLLNVLSAGDSATARHSRRVANLVDVLAGAVGIRGDEHATLRVAALLHDMGKIEDDLFPLLHSAAPLSAEERERINKHPCVSASILEPLEAFHPGLTRIVSSHHESWNGEGYPAGLRGEEIPLGARIIAVADVFDAVTQPRSYHEAAPIEDAFTELRRGAGSRFDPRLLALLEAEPVREALEEIALAGRAEEAEGGAAAPESSAGRAARNAARPPSFRSGSAPSRR